MFCRYVYTPVYELKKKMGTRPGSYQCDRFRKRKVGYPLKKCCLAGEKYLLELAQKGLDAGCERADWRRCGREKAQTHNSWFESRKSSASSVSGKSFAPTPRRSPADQVVYHKHTQERA
jgi:hypothetical protein